MKTKIIIMGAGGFGREVASWINPGPRPLWYVDTSEMIDYGMQGEFIVGDEFRDHAHNAIVYLGVGPPAIRARFYSLAISAQANLPDFYHRTAFCASKLGQSSFACPGVIVSPDVVIGVGVLLNLNVTVGHDCFIDHFVNIAPGAHISGNVKIGTKAYIGTGAVIREGVRIGEGATVGMGAVIVKDVPAGETWVGNPARRLK